MKLLLCQLFREMMLEPITEQKSASETQGKRREVILFKYQNYFQIIFRRYSRLLNINQRIDETKEKAGNSNIDPETKVLVCLRGSTVCAAQVHIMIKGAAQVVYLNIELVC